MFVCLPERVPPWELEPRNVRAKTSSTGVTSQIRPSKAECSIVYEQGEGGTEKEGETEVAIQSQDTEQLGLASAEHPILPEFLTSFDSSLFGDTSEDFYEDFYGFPLLKSHASDLNKIYCIEGKFWENCMLERANTIAAMLGELGSALSLKEKTWMSMSPDELTTIIQSVGDALKVGFKLDCLKPVLEKAKTVLWSFKTRCRLEALQKEKNFLETQLQSVISQIQSLELELISNSEGLDLECRCLASIFS
uniref:Uncharacterized protein n=1 Tax=Manihot esculenta TaxID=3983 RepID=A0A2C9V6N9_MANES